MTDPAKMRRNYADGELSETTVAADWLTQLRVWFDVAAGDPRVAEPNAVQLATVAADGHPSVRTVLVKEIDERGIVFYTGYSSAKGRDLALNPWAAAVFAWLPLERQVRLSGPAEQVSREETAAYFATRPRGSQVAAWASPQSDVVASRDELQRLFHQAEARFAQAPVPPPPGWGGYLLRPAEVEFWQGRQDRLHDRLRFRRSGPESDPRWLVERLAS